MKKIFSILLLIALGFAACEDPKQLSLSRYQEWVQDHESQFNVEKKVNDIQLSVRYIPADIMAYNDLKNEYQDEHVLDSVREFYKCGLHFQVVLEADPSKKNLLYYNVTEDSEYKERIEALSFRTEEFISLDRSGERAYPVLSQYEGYNELRNKITLHVVFSPAWYTCEKFNPSVKDFALVFDDPYWGMGTNKFFFKPEFIKNIPSLKF